MIKDTNQKKIKSHKQNEPINSISEDEDEVQRNPIKITLN